MNILPYYKKASSAFIILSPYSNYLYKYLPPKLFLIRVNQQISKKYSLNFFRNQIVRLLGNVESFKFNVVDSEKIIECSDSFILKKFDLLGSGSTRLDPINWHIDFKTGFEWKSGKFYLDYNQVDLSNNSDVKVPRELSRCHHLLILGQAYLITGKEIYSEEIINTIDNWIDENDLMRSINWGCAMDVSIRAVNWIYAVNMIINSPLVTQVFISKFSRSLYEHGWFIFRNLEKSIPNSGNHYAANISGLLYLGKFFAEIGEGQRWFNFGLQEYYNEVRSQILPSGPQFEKSISYHRLVTELFYYSSVFLTRNNINIPLDIRHRIEQMFDFILFYTMPNGRAPIIGDEDNGRFLPFSITETTDHRYLLTIGSISFNSPVMKKYSARYFNDAFFILGEESLRKYVDNSNSTQFLKSKSFSDAGFCIIRSNEFYLFINNSGSAKYSDLTTNGGSHAHADMLSFVLTLGQTAFIVDPGSFVYTSSAKDRNLFRSTRMHNTISVDDKNQHILPDDNLFLSLNIGKPVNYSFGENNHEIVFSGSHDGFEKYDGNIIHKRDFIFNKDKFSLDIVDKLIGNGLHKIDLFFHFGIDVTLKIEEDQVFLFSNTENTRMKIIFTADFEYRLYVLDSFLSTSYGRKCPNKVLKFSALQECPVSILTSILTY